MELEQSIEELMWECYNQAVKLGYSISERGYLETVNPQPPNISDDFWDEIWSWIDGLYQKSFFNRMNGECSLQQALDFDMTKEENYMKNFLNRMKATNKPA